MSHSLKYQIRLTNTCHVAMFLIIVFVGAELAAADQVTVLVIFDGKPLKGLHLTYWDSEQSARVNGITNERGEATLVIQESPLPLNLSVDCDRGISCDFVLRGIRIRQPGLRACAVRSQSWLARTKPRACDELARTHDIVRGGLATMSATEYDRWYARLSRATVSDCHVLAKLQGQTGSLSPWYFYEFKALPQNCNGERLVAELDWTSWYRDLLEKATGAKPGKCKSAWERWWVAHGYSPVPDPQQEEQFEVGWE